MLVMTKTTVTQYYRNPIIKGIEKGMDASIESWKFADGAIPKFSSDFTR